MVAKYFMIAAILVCTLIPLCHDPALADDDFAFNLYAGWMTDGDFGEALSGSAEFVDAYLVLGAVAWTFARYFDDALSFELEGQVGKWFGNQKNMEFNLPVAFRWRKFPWDDTVDTSFAYGVGPSYATLDPAQEIENEGDTKKFLVYWFAEIALGPPESNWAGILRLHHRSGAFGLVAEKGHGGSNTLAAGIKYRF